MTANDDSAPATGRPIIRARSPLRISFAGGGTDIAAWYATHGGAVLSATISRSAYVTLAPRADRRINVRSLDLGYAIDYSLDETLTFDGVLDLAKAAVKRLGSQCGMDISIRSDAPAGSGLGGSSALAAALAGALACQWGISLGRRELAELAYTLEREDLDICGGKQDQYATVFGGFNHIEFNARGVSVHKLPIATAVKNDLEAHLLLCYVGRVRKDAGLVDAQVRDLRAGRAETLTGMCRVQADVGKMKDALLAGRLDAVGRGLHDAFAHKKMTNPGVTAGTEADALYEAALRQGALGGKLLGAGGGGYLLLYVPTGRQHAVRRALEEMGGRFEEFSFRERGLEVWPSSQA